MFKDVIRGIDGLGSITAIAAVLFFSIFLAKLIAMLFLDGGHVEHMSQLPLEGNGGESGECNHE